jgi:plastocyanin
VRHGRRGRRLIWRARPIFGLVLLAVLASGCKKPDRSLEPEALLRDSLGLGEDDRVHRIRLSSPENRELIEPAAVDARPGDFVQFLTDDRRVHAVRFVLDSLPPGGADFLKAGAQESSPPLVEPASRFLVTFEGAPVGRYPFVVVGNGTEARGVIVVAEPTSR